MAKELTKMSKEELEALAQQSGPIPVKEIKDSDQLTQGEKVDLIRQEINRIKKHRRQDFVQALAPEIAKLCRKFRNEHEGCTQADLTRSLTAATKMV